jgi:hypothetical protein
MVGEATTLLNIGYNDIFYLKIDSLGENDWVYQCYTNDILDLSPGQIRKGIDNSIYASGSFRTRGIFGNDTIEVSKLSAYLTRFDSIGNFFGTATFGEATNIWMSVLNDGAVALCGLQSGLTNIGDTSFTTYPGSLSGFDNYIAKFNAITGIQTISKPSTDRLFIYANPTTGLCTIEIPEEFEHVQQLTLFVYDQQGRLLKQAEIVMEEEKVKLNLEALAKGMYTAVITNGKKQYSGKIIFQ